MLCLSMYLCVWESGHFVRVCVCRHLCNSVHMAPYGSWDLHLCGFYMCVSQWTRVHLASLSQWELRDMFLRGSKSHSSQCTFRRAGWDSPFSSQRHTVCWGSGDSSSAPFGRVSEREQQKAMAWIGLWFGLHSGIKARCCLLQDCKQNQSQLCQQTIFSCKIAVGYMGGGQYF